MTLHCERRSHPGRKHTRLTYTDRCQRPFAFHLITPRYTPCIIIQVETQDRVPEVSERLEAVLNGSNTEEPCSLNTFLVKAEIARRDEGIIIVVW